MHCHYDNCCAAGAGSLEGNTAEALGCVRTNMYRGSSYTNCYDAERSCSCGCGCGCGCGCDQD